MITVFAVLLSRICFLLPLPGLDRRFLHGVLDAGPLGAMKDPFGDLLQTPGNVFQLGFGAMVFSSIVVQVLVSVVPSLKQKTREGGTGEAFIKNLTLYIFAAAAVVQGCLTAGLLQPYLLRGTFAGLLVNLVAGAMILKTACTLIDNHGVGDGFLNVLVANIAAEYAVVVRHVLAKFAQGLVAPAHLLGLVASVCVCVLASVWLTGEREREREKEGRRGADRVAPPAADAPSTPPSPPALASTEELPISYYSRSEDQDDLDESYGGREPYLPFRINPTGMQPIIIASYLLHLPSQLASAVGGPWLALGAALGTPLVYYPLYFALLYASAFLDINETSREVSLYLGKIGAIVPGVRPGKATELHVEAFRRRTIRKGAGLLAALGTFSIATEVFFRRRIGASLSLTSMLLLTSAVMQVRRQVESYRQAPRLERAIRNHEARTSVGARD